MSRIAAHVPKAGDYYPTVRAWMARLGTTELDIRANRIMVSPRETHSIMRALLVPQCTLRIRRMRRCVGRASRRKNSITIDRSAFEQNKVSLGTILHECAHIIVRRREQQQPPPGTLFIFRCPLCNRRRHSSLERLWCKRLHAHAEMRRVGSQPAYSSAHGEEFCRTYANLLRRVMSHSLRPGQVIRRHNELWRVLYVNECRARILPYDRDDRPETNERYGENIAPTSLVDIVTNVERVKDEIELAKAEAELLAAKRELAAETVAAKRKEANDEQMRRELAQAEAELAAAKREFKEAVARGEAPTETARAGRGMTTWSLAPGDRIIGSHPAGSLKHEVLTFLRAHPGASTKQVQANSASTPGAVAACLDRFWKAGVVVKS